MARPLRIEYPGAVYHLTSRGNARAEIFLDDADRETFLRVLASVVERFAWYVYAYCLMGNHYHLLAETRAPNLSRGMRRLNGIYTQRFNRRHGRVGHVLQGRFNAILVEREGYLLELARYIALNPVRAGMVCAPGEWRWSSYRATAGLLPAPSWLSVTPLLRRFSEEPESARDRFRKFVDEGLGGAPPWSDLRGQVLLGTDAFVRAISPRLARLNISPETPRPQRLAGRPGLEVLLDSARAGPKSQRNALILEAHVRHGYTLGEIARHLGLHYSTVSRIANPPAPQFKT